MLICISLWIFTTVKGGSSYVQDHYACSPSLVLWDGDVRLMLSSAFFHLGVLHIIFNMLATYFLLKPVERTMGSLAMIGQIMSAAFISSLIYCTTFYILYKMFNKLSFMYYGVAGFSGVLFFYIPITLAVLNVPAVMFCCLEIPAAFYPWFLLLLMSFGSGVSFMGHLSGLLVSYLYCYGLLNWLSLPRSWLINFEKTKLGQLILRLPGWIPTPPELPPTLASKHFAFTTATFESTKFGQVVNSIVSKISNCCCSCCVPEHSLTSGSFQVGGAGGGFMRGRGHVLGQEISDDTDLEAGTPSRGPPIPSQAAFGSYQNEDAQPQRSPQGRAPAHPYRGRQPSRPAHVIAELKQAARGAGAQSKPDESAEQKQQQSGIPATPPPPYPTQTVESDSTQGASRASQTAEGTVTSPGRAVDPSRTNRLGYSQLDGEDHL